MNPIVAQALAIAGVLLGSAATFVVTSTTERTRWRRAQSARRDDKRLLAYSEYANAVKHMVRLSRTSMSEQAWHLEHILREEHPDTSSFIDATETRCDLRNDRSAA